jgi:pyruvate dehydrogenase E1 component alpha subunit
MAENNDATDARVTVDPERAERVREIVGDERIVQMYRDMTLIRRFEEQAGRAYQMGKIKGFCHLYIGQEAVAVGSMATVGDDDYIIAAYREHGHALARGLHPNAVMAELFGKRDGSSGGKGGSMHIFDVSKNFYGGWGIVGGHLPTAAGMAFASKYKEENAVVLCYFGEGSIHQGVVHETLNLAQLWKLPVVFITENNKYAMGTSIERISAVTDIQKKAIGYDMAHGRVDGDDIFAVYEAIDEAVVRARDEQLPTFLDVRTYRYRGHSMSDPAKYRTKEEVEEHQRRDPITRLGNWMVDSGIATEDQLDEIDAESKKAAKESVKFADKSEQPDPSTLTEHVYVDWDAGYL